MLLVSYVKTPGRKKKVAQVENGESGGAKAITPKKRRLSAGEKKQMVSAKSPSLVNHAPRKSAGSYLLDRPAIISRPVSDIVGQYF